MAVAHVQPFRALWKVRGKMQTIREHVDLIETITVLFVGRMNFQYQHKTLWLIVHDFASLTPTPAHIVHNQWPDFYRAGIATDILMTSEPWPQKTLTVHIHLIWTRGKVKSWFERLQNSCDLLQGSPVGLQGLSASLVWIVWVASSCWRAVRYLRLGSGYCNGCDQVRIHPCSKPTQENL